jgi:hypothetical protein
VLLAKTHQVVDSFWIAAPKLTDIYTIPLVTFSVGEIPSLERVLGPTLGRLAHGVPTSVVMVSPMVVLAAVGCVTQMRHCKWTLGITVMALGVPILLLFVLSFAVRPLLIAKVVLPTAVPLVLLWGAGVTVRGPWWRVGVAFAVIVLGELALSAFYFHDHHGRDGSRKEGWREVSIYLQDKVKDGDLIVVDPQRGLYLLARYDRSGKLSRAPLRGAKACLTPDRSNATADFEALLRGLPRGQRVWVVEWAKGAGARGIKDCAEKILGEVESRNFAGVSLSEFGMDENRRFGPVAR